MTFDQDGGSWRVLLAPRLWVAGAMGFASGLPLLLTLTVLQAWLTDNEVSLTTIGFAGLVGLPYTVKFLWAPLLDRFKPLGLGRRRSWLMIFQCCLAASIVLLGLQNPSQSLVLVAVAALLVTFSVVVSLLSLSLADEREKRTLVALSVSPARLSEVVVAKGIDHIAMRICEVARENNVPIVENRAVARALYAGVEIDQEVPTEHFKAVAEVISYVMRLKGQL